MFSQSWSSFYETSMVIIEAIKFHRFTLFFSFSCFDFTATWNGYMHRLYIEASSFYFYFFYDEGEGESKKEIMGCGSNMNIASRS